MIPFPLRYARGNILFGRGDERAALYRVPMVSYPYKPVGDKWIEMRRLERFAFAVGADVSLWRVNRAYPAERYAPHLDPLFDERHQDDRAWRAYLAGQTERVSELGSHVPELYLAISLKETGDATIGAALLRAIDRSRRRVEDLAGVGSPQPVSHRELEALAAIEQRTYERVLAVFDAQRATTDDLQWLLRRAPCRGVGEPELDAYWQPDALVLDGDGELRYEPLETDLWRLANAPVLEYERHLIIDSEQGTSHQALLALGSLPDEPMFPGDRAELLSGPLEALDFPVDAVLHAQWLGNREALAQVRKRIMDVDNAYAEAYANSRHGAGWLADEDRERAREFEAILQSETHPPMLYAWIGFAVGAASSDELQQRVDALQDRYGDIALHRPAGLQEQLFYDHLPRAGGGRTRDYVQQMTIEQFAATMPVATTLVGSSSGIYLGWTPGGARPVKFDPTEASRTSRPSAILLAGTLGSGKTVSAQAIAYAAERRGSQVVDLDPKPDHGWENVPGLEGRLEVIELAANEENRGKLDPLTIAPEGFREELAASYYVELLRSPSPAWENAIQRAVRDVVRRGEQSSLAVIDELRAMGKDAAGEVADALEVVSTFGLAQLGFGDGTQHTRAAGAPVTTIRMPGLTLPDPRANRDHYQRAERVSAATLQLVAAYALRLVSGDRSRHSIVLFDEAWFLLGSPQGRTTIDRLVRAGRAMNATILLATQRLDDLGELADLIGVKLIFGQESEAEARRALGLLGLDPEDRGRVQQIRQFRRGRCLMRDLDDRIAEVQVDLVYDDLLEALDTTPRRHDVHPSRRAEVVG